MNLNRQYQHLSLHFVGDDDSDVIVFLHERERQSLIDFAFSSSILLCFISGNDWERDFSPFPHAKVFHGGKDFPGQAKEYLDVLRQGVLPYVENVIPLKNKKKILAGYSLAGLFALYASLQSDVFSGVGVISGSLWYPDFLPYLEEHPCHAKHIYLSIGERESKTKNPYLSLGYAAQKEASLILSKQNRDVCFELNQGGHFDQVEARIQRGLSWLVLQEREDV